MDSDPSAFSTESQPDPFEGADLAELSKSQVYALFNEYYGGPTFERDGLEYNEVLINRFLHRDTNHDRSLRLIVRSRTDTGYQPTMMTHAVKIGGDGSRGGDRVVNNYASDRLLVATTDGVDVVEWTTEGVYGYDSARGKYGPDYESLVASLRDPQTMHSARLYVARGSNEGIMDFYNGAGGKGWILSQEDTDRQEVIVAALEQLDEQYPVVIARAAIERYFTSKSRKNTPASA